MPSPTLTDKVAKMICQDILQGKLRPGQKLVVADLKEKYGVGASPIREALVQLSWIKYVKLEPQKGCWVAPFCEHELRDLYESLRVVSPVLLKKAIACSSEGWELDLLTAYHKLSRAKNIEISDSWSEWEERQQHFFTTLLAGAEAKNMYAFFSDLINQIKRYRYFALSQHQGHKHSLFDIEEHEMIMKFALAKNSEEAVRLLDSHLDSSMKMIESAIQAA
ncbi:GntR family transcriptional regulator [Vibrio vulnificus]|nr:GntR family transcriptional regulator [Vibrio vulnificus]